MWPPSLCWQTSHLIGFYSKINPRSLRRGKKAQNNQKENARILVYLLERFNKNPQNLKKNTFENYGLSGLKWKFKFDFVVFLW